MFYVLYAKDKSEVSVMYLLYLHVFIKIPVMMRDMEKLLAIFCSPLKMTQELRHERG